MKIMFFDQQKAEELLNELFRHIEAGTFPYHIPDYLPQNFIPDAIKESKLLCARFVFFLCLYMRGGIESMVATTQMVLMHAKHPELFDPYQAAELTEKEIAVRLQKYMGKWDLENISNYWRENARLLVAHWEGNPLLLFGAVKDYEGLATLMRNKKGGGSYEINEQGFWGFQYKMVSMFCYFTIVLDLIPAREFPPPVDFHHFRIYFGTEILRVVTERKGNKDTALLPLWGIEVLKITSRRGSIRYQEEMQKPMREFLLEYSRKTGRSNVDVADVLWTYSLVMCGQAPANTIRRGTFGTKRNKKKKKKDLDKLSPRLKLKEPRGPAAAQRRNIAAYLRTCGRCVIRDACKYGVPAQAYFQQGTFNPIPHQRDPEVEAFLRKQPVAPTPRQTQEEQAQDNFGFPEDPEAAAQ